MTYLQPLDPEMLLVPPCLHLKALGQGFERVWRSEKHRSNVSDTTVVMFVDVMV